MIFHKDFVFGHLQKTGGTFVEDFLIYNVEGTKIREKGNKYEGIRSDPSRHDPLYDDCINDREIKKFGFIRNPFDWYLSFWSFTKYTHTVIKNLYVSSKEQEDINAWIKSIFSMTENIHRMLDFSTISRLDIGLLTFEYLYVFYHPDVFNDIENHDKYLLADEILKFENLREELDIFFSKNLFKFNERQTEILYSNPKNKTSKHKHYNEYYNDESIELIRHKDRIIFDKYEYKF